jgi:type I restriction enzyme S subunit
MKLVPYPEYKDSGVPWFGIIPEKWKCLRLRNAVDLLVSNVDKHTKENELPVRLCNYVDVYKRDYLTSSMQYMKATATKEEIERFRLHTDDVVITKDSENYLDIAVPAYVKDQSHNWICGYHLAILRPRQKIVTGKYLHWCIQGIAVSTQFSVSANGVTRYGLSHSDIKNVIIPVPKHDEQTQIARFLDWKTAQINKFIRNKRRLIELLKEQKQNIINQAVTRGLDPNVKLKPSGVEWIGDIPEHWDARRLRTLAAVRASGVDKNTNEDEVPVMLCNYVDVYKNDRITAAIDFMKATATPEEIRAFELKAGDVIITKDSESWDDIAIPTFVPETIPGVVCAYHLALIRPFSGEIEGEFLFRAFSSDPVADQFRIAATGVTRFGLAQGAIKGAFFPLPPLEEQRAIIAHINEKCAEISQAISRAEREIELMREYRTRLISDVVTGQVDVRGIEVPEVAEDELLALEEDTAESDDVIDDEGDMDETD